MNRLIFSFFIIIVGSIHTGFSQYSPIYSQYLTNGLVINPAYAGSRNALSATLAYRRQWVGFDGAPELQVLGAHTLLKNEKIGLGLLLFNEKYGITSNKGIFANYAFHLRIGNGKLSMGLKGGIYSIEHQLNQLITTIPDDAFAENNETLLMPGVGVGFYYYTPKWFVGFSVPDMLSYRAKSGQNEFETYHDISNYNYYLTGGMVVNIDANFKIRPSVLLYYKYDLQFDVNLNGIVRDKLWVGTSYRYKESLIGILGYQVNSQLYAGYSYDFPLRHLRGYSNGSHEIMLRYDFNFSIEGISPKFF